MSKDCLQLDYCWLIQHNILCKICQMRQQSKLVLTFNKCAQGYSVQPDTWLACPHSHQTVYSAQADLGKIIFTPQSQASSSHTDHRYQSTDPKPLAIRRASTAKRTKSSNLHRPLLHSTALLPNYWFPPKLWCPSSLWTCLNGVQQKGNLRC